MYMYICMHIYVVCLCTYIDVCLYDACMHAYVSGHMCIHVTEKETQAFLHFPEGSMPLRYFVCFVLI